MVRPTNRKRILNVVRILACVAALFIVIQGVTLDDHVRLVEVETSLIGTVTEETDKGVVLESDGRARSFTWTEIAVDANGHPRVSYGLRTAWRRSRSALLLLAVAIHFVVVFPQALRFRWMLQAQKIAVSYWDCLKLSFAGNFLNFATPLGSNIGDVFKAWFVAQHTERKTEAATTVFLDRLVGLGSLLLVVAGITSLSPAGSRLAQVRPYMLTMLGIGIVATVAYFSPMLRGRLLPRQWLSRLPMAGQLQRIDNAAQTLIRKTRILIGAVLLTAILQAIAIGAYFTVAVAMGMRAGADNVLEYYTYFYTGVLVQTLPGPPQGLGTVELTYRYFLAPFGSPSQIVCMAFAIRVVVLLCALPGLLVTLTGAYRPARGGFHGGGEPLANPASRSALQEVSTPSSGGSGLPPAGTSLSEVTRQVK